MRRFEAIAGKSADLCIGAVALALGQPGAAVPAAQGMAGVAVNLLGERRDDTARKARTEAERAIGQLDGTPEFRDANPDRALALLDDGALPRLDAATLRRAMTDHETDGARIDALTEAVLTSLPFDGDTDATCTLLRHALHAAMAVWWADEALRARIDREVLVGIARQGNLTHRKLDEILRNVSGASLDELRALAGRFGGEGLHDPREIRSFLEEKAQDYTAYRTLIDKLDERVPAIADLKGAAQDAAARLDFDAVENMLSRVDAVETEIAAETKEARAANALLRGRAEQAARILSAAADSFAALDPSEPARRRIDYGNQMFKHGWRYGGPGLALAAEMYRAAGDALARTEQWDAWARAQGSLGNTLQDQGIRTGGAEGTALLAQAVDSYDAALKVLSRTAHPVDWAKTQINLGNALQEQSKRAGGAEGAALLAQAVDAYNAALEVLTREAHPMDWAATQNNLGNTLQAQGIRTGGSEGAALLARAVDAYRAALEVRTRAAHPVGWAQTQNNLGNALQAQGTRTGGAEGAALLARAIDAFSKALEVLTREDHPAQWATTRENMARVHTAIADLGATIDPAGHLRAALGHVEAALTVFDPEHMAFNHHKATALRDHLCARLGL